MSATFATGRKALGLCDRCGQQRLLHELADQIIDQKKSGLLVCNECNDIDQPQLQLGKRPVFDPQALRNPRPDSRADIYAVPQFTGFTATGAPLFTLTIALAGVGGTGRVGSVTGTAS